MTKTKKGAASIYIVIFTTTLLGVIALSFVRIMLSESMRTTNYSLSQSAYNSALAGIEDAKIVLLRYQNCISNSTYLNGAYKKNCGEYRDRFNSEKAAQETAESCDTVRELMGYAGESENETIIQTQDTEKITGTGSAFDQAYTCVKISSYTDDYLTTLNSDIPTKIIPIRTENNNKQDSINRITLQWFSDENYRSITTNNNGTQVLNAEYFGIDGTTKSLKGTLTGNVGAYGKENIDKLSNQFVKVDGNPKYLGIAPPPLQATLIQTAKSFSLDQFYKSNGIGDKNQTNRGTLLLRPSAADALVTDDGMNFIPREALAYSANKSFNTPIDVKCDPEQYTSNTGYACSADIYVPEPIGHTTDNTRNDSTSFVVVSLPYGVPETEVRMKMYKCVDRNLGINATIEGDRVNCETVRFANVQPTVDSTGRANDLFRRVEARIELVDTYFPIVNYALALTDPSNKAGVEKNFYVTNNCQHSSTMFSANEDNGKGATIYNDGRKSNGKNVKPNYNNQPQNIYCKNSGKSGSNGQGHGNGDS